jgi:L-2-hydroxyglutarate oxidase LhgO
VLERAGDGNDKDVVAGSRPPAPVHIIEPVPTQFTKGVIVFTTVYGNVVVGPTAVDQPDKEDRSTGRPTAATDISLLAR